ncbi:MAG: hypothetical protein JEY91_15195 [Spirochaetaceae bacterium]|nr:hypothetical protein [Spirochaetaceae bacterium]
MNKIIRLSYIFMVMLLMTTCSNTGIFLSLENEEEIKESNNLNNSANISNMVIAGDFYIGNGGPSIFYRSTNTSTTDSKIDDWSTLLVPETSFENPSVYFSRTTSTTSMVLLNGDLYISRISFDGSSVISGIYRLPNADTIDISALTAASWEKIIEVTTEKASSSFNSNVFRLFEAQSSLYINHLTYFYSGSDDQTASISSSALYVTTTPETIADNLANATAIDISSFFSELSNPVEVAKITTSGTNYWMIINSDTSTDGSDPTLNKVLRSTDSTTFTEVTAIPDARYVDIYEYKTNPDVLLVSNTSGSLYISINADSAPTSADLVFTELANESVFLNGFEDIGALVPDNVIVGTSATYDDGSIDGEGYYQLDLSDLSNITWSVDNFSHYNNYFSSELSTASINGFLFDSAKSRLFAYTRSMGLWMNILPDNKTEREWSRE